MLKTQFVVITWTKRNKLFFERKGYKFSNYGDHFYVKTEDAPKVTYIRIEYYCDICGKELSKSIQEYYKYKKEKDLCRGCERSIRAKNSRHSRAVKMIAKCRKIAEENNLRLISTEDDYINNQTDIYFECYIHGIQHIPCYNFTRGFLCPLCGIDRRTKASMLPVEDVKEYIEQFNNNIWLNPDEWKGIKERNLKIQCGCGNVFVLSFENYRNNNQHCCKECSKKISKGEKKIQCFLDNSFIQYKTQFTFNNCRDIKKLPFDFYLNEYNMAIEFDGRQHYIVVDHYGGKEGLIVRQKHDEIKNIYCKEHNIELLRIPYWEYDNIEMIIKQKLDEIGKRNSLIS